MPGFIGLSSENGAHRIAVEWTENGETKEGVFIPRRDTSSLFNTWAGGRIFPGRHFHARFDVQEENGRYRVAYKSSDGTEVAVDACETDALNEDSIFGNLANASAFFEKGALGYSPHGGRAEGLRLRIFNWKIQPLKMIACHAGFFENESIFPRGAVLFDNILLMTKLRHEWHAAGSK